MKRLVMFLLFAGTSVGIGGCATTSSVGKFVLYGFLEDAEMVVRNNTPLTVVVNVGGLSEDYTLPPGGKLTIPVEYPFGARVQAYIPVTATVTPLNPFIRSGGTTWHLSHYGHYLGSYGGTWTTGKYVHATIELENTRPDAKQNSLQFKVQR